MSVEAEDQQQQLAAANEAAKKRRRKKKAAGGAASTDGDEQEQGVDASSSTISNKDDANDADGGEPSGTDADGKKKKKKKKDKAEKAAAQQQEKKDDKSGVKGKGPSKKALAAILQMQQQKKEELEAEIREEEERIRREEEALTKRQEEERRKREAKERKKTKEQAKKERQKREGTYLTAKQKVERQRAQAQLEAARQQGHFLIGRTEEELKAKAGAGDKEKDKDDDESEKKRDKSDEQVSDGGSESDEETSVEEEDESEEVLENWEEALVKKPLSNAAISATTANGKENVASNNVTDQAALNAKLNKLVKQVESEADSKVRSPIICVLGHVDTGKTKLLDYLRKTHVQDNEAGGITQQIGATFVPPSAIQEQCKIAKEPTALELPGLLIIDTPGHESFSNLRTRGSSLCDIAILVIDIMHGLEPQTLESINLLKARKTPFIVALNKIDRLYGWRSSNKRDVEELINSQANNTQIEFNKRKDEIILQLNEQSLNAALYYQNPDPRTYVSLVPTSAAVGDGMGNLINLMIGYCQKRLHDKLKFDPDRLEASVLEVKALPGLGTTVDVVLVNGRLREGERIVLAGHDGPICTQIRSLLVPQPLRELRVKTPFQELKTVKGSIGVKICAHDLEKAVAGLELHVARNEQDVERLKQLCWSEFGDAMKSIKCAEKGVYVQASTLGSLEALLEFLKVSKIPYSGIRIGPVVKRDVMKASTMLEMAPDFAVILAFDVKVERDAQELADSMGLRIFTADIIYHLFDKFTAYTNELKARRKEQYRNIAVFPCKMRILPNCIFNARDPIVVGVSIEDGILVPGTPICVPSKEFIDIGRISGIESNHKQVESARKGQEVCIKIENASSDAPKAYNRHFDHNDMLVSRISRESIDACKEYFRDDLIKADWQLMIELKKIFEII